MDQCLRMVKFWVFESLLLPIQPLGDLLYIQHHVAKDLNRRP